MAASRYRKFMRLCEEWPVDNSKHGRDFGSFLRQCVAKAFNRGELTTINEKECDEKYDSLQKLNSNHYLKMYSGTGTNALQAPLAFGSIGFTYEQCHSLSTTDYLQEQMIEKPGVFSRIRLKLSYNNDNDSKKNTKGIRTN